MQCIRIGLQNRIKNVNKNYNLHAFFSIVILYDKNR